MTRMLRWVPGMTAVAVATVATGCADNRAADTSLNEPGKPVVYQMFTRLYGNKNATNKPWGTRAENGVGKFSDIDSVALASIRELGTTHIWFTGVPHHAVIGDYREYGIGDDDPDVVKGRAGSPYAVKDYYSVNPDLADDPARRLDEFDALIERTHAQGMKVLIDIVPNHVARRYQSIAAPDGVRDFGADDDPTKAWAFDNDFYYVVGENFRVPTWENGYQPLGGEAHPLADGSFDEQPAKWTGNGARSAQPGQDDWYETVKINYGVRPDGSYAFPPLPADARDWTLTRHAEFWRERETALPPSWGKVRDIALYWLARGVDGFRFDMAEMVPVEFWSYLNSSIKAVNPDAFLLAEVYDPSRYRDYLQLGRMDYLYDKVGLYDSIRAVMRGEQPASAIHLAQESVRDIEGQMLHFMENHDEQRIASDAFAGSAERGKPAMVVSALIGSSPTMIYFGQEVGEPGDHDAGFGDPSRTTLFDYWGVPAHQRYMNGGAFDGGAASEAELALRRFYRELLILSSREAAFLGDYAALKLDTATDRSIVAFARWRDDRRVVVVSNFSADREATADVILAAEVIEAMRLGNGDFGLRSLLGERAVGRLEVRDGTGRLSLNLEPLESGVLAIEPR